MAPTWSRDLFPYILTTTELFTIERIARAKNRVNESKANGKSSKNNNNNELSILMNLHVCVVEEKNRIHMYWRFLISHMQYRVSSFSWFLYVIVRYGRKCRTNHLEYIDFCAETIGHNVFFVCLLPPLLLPSIIWITIYVVNFTFSMQRHFWAHAHMASILVNHIHRIMEVWKRKMRPFFVVQSKRLKP